MATQKRPVISGSFAENDLQLKASYGFSSPCRYISTKTSLGDMYTCVLVGVYVPIYLHGKTDTHISMDMS